MAWQSGWRSLSVLFVIPESGKRVWVWGREKEDLRVHAEHPCLPQGEKGALSLQVRCMSKPGSGWEMAGLRGTKRSDGKDWSRYEVMRGRKGDRAIRAKLGLGWGPKHAHARHASTPAKPHTLYVYTHAQPDCQTKESG